MSFNKSLHLSLGLTLSLGLLSACPAQPTANGSTPPTASPAPEASASSTPRPTPTPGQTTPPEGETPGTPATGASATPTPTAMPGSFSLPANLSRIQFSAKNDRFLDQVGEQTQFQVELIDNLGQVIDANVPLEWTSSRPDDFSVDAEGHLTAKVASGFSTITVRIPGTNFEARTIINVIGGGSSGGGGGGGGSTNQAPVINNLSASSTTITGAGALVKLNASASDAESTLEANQYTWSCVEAGCSAQFTSTQGPEVYWRSPATGGNYTLQLTVSDGSRSVSQEIIISVQTGQGQLQVNPTPP